MNVLASWNSRLAALRTDRTWYFTGMVDDVAVWKRALAEDEILSVYLQKEGDAQRTLIFADQAGNRNPAGTPDGNGGDPALPNMDKLMIGNNSSNAVLFDDIYISTSGYNSTVPRPLSSTAPPASLSLSTARRHKLRSGGHREPWNPRPR